MNATAKTHQVVRTEKIGPLTITIAPCGKRNYGQENAPVFVSSSPSCKLCASYFSSH